jgi:hypothetical protein
MGQRIDRVVAGIRHLFEEQAVHVTDERVIRYIVEELRKSRDFDDVMADPYVVNHTDAESRARLLETPRILEGIEAQICSEYSDYRASHS